jgi:RNA polymerase sigma-70 factor (ECF subfamily)
MSSGPTYRTEDEILEGLRGDAPGAFEAFFRHFADLVYGFGFKLTGEDAAAADILRAAMVNTLRSVKDLKHPKAVERWILREACNAFKAMKGAGANPGDGEIPMKELLPDLKGGRSANVHDWSLDPDEEERRSEEKRLLRQLVLEMPPHDALVLVLHDMEETPPQEIADILQIPVRSVKTWLHRGRLFLRRELSRDLSKEPAHKDGEAP